MGRLSPLIDAAGRSSGKCRPWEPSASPQESRCGAVIAPIIGDRFIRVDYTRSYHREAQQGLLLVGCKDKARLVSAIWMDSWHMGRKFMVTAESAPG